MSRKSHFSGDLSKWNVTNLQVLDEMFSHSRFNGNVSTWQLTMPLTLNRVFEFSAFQGDVSNLDVSTVHSMVGLFEGSQFNGDLSKWNVSNVQTFARMFKNSQFNGDISNWTIGRADNMLEMFEGARFNGELTRWNWSKVKEFRRMFKDSAFAGDLSSIALRPYATCSGMFDASFEGVLPHTGKMADRFKTYGCLLGSASALRSYLKNRPFNAVHADVLLGAKSKPGWATAKDYEWCKTQEAVAKSLGFDEPALRRMLVENYHQRQEASLPLPTLDMGQLG